MSRSQAGSCVGQVGGAGEVAALQGQGADRRLDGAGRAEGVAVEPLGAADRDALGVRAEGGPDRVALGRVVEHGRGAVGVDVVDRLRRQPGVDQRAAHRPRGLDAVGVGRGHVVGVVGGGVAGDLGVDVGAAGAGVLPRLQDQQRRPLGHHEAVAVGVEGAAGGGRVVVAGGQDPDQGEGAEGERRQRRLRPAGQHHPGAAVGDQAGRLADRDQRRRRRSCRWRGTGRSGPSSMVTLEEAAPPKTESASIGLTRRGPRRT